MAKEEFDNLFSGESLCLIIKKMREGKYLAWKLFKITQS